MANKKGSRPSVIPVSDKDPLVQLSNYITNGWEVDILRMEPPDSELAEFGDDAEMVEEAYHLFNPELNITLDGHALVALVNGMVAYMKKLDPPKFKYGLSRTRMVLAELIDVATRLKREGSPHDPYEVLSKATPQNLLFYHVIVKHNMFEVDGKLMFGVKDRIPSSESKPRSNKRKETKNV